VPSSRPTEFPKDLAWNAAAVWAGPDCHLVHYPLRGGEQYNVVVTFHSRETETWGVSEGSQERCCRTSTASATGAPAPAPAEELEALGHRRPGADRALEPRPVTLLGDAAHPMLQYLAQGACMALEDAARSARRCASRRRPAGRVRASTSARASPAPRGWCC
jgi:salicylate hydroxylase